MDPQFLVMAVLTAFPLAYVSLLLYIRLSSQRVPNKRIWRLLGEVWGIFALIFVIFALVSRRLGTVPHSSITKELGAQLELVRALPLGHQLFVGAAMLLALGLFGHLLWSLQRLQRHDGRNFPAIEQRIIRARRLIVAWNKQARSAAGC